MTVREGEKQEERKKTKHNQASSVGRYENTNIQDER